MKTVRNIARVINRGRIDSENGRSIGRFPSVGKDLILTLSGSHLIGRVLVVPEPQGSWNMYAPRRYVR